ncbi:MAG: hypothetical protein AAGE61_09355 [Pseudomonadota bacterium]
MNAIVSVIRSTGLAAGVLTAMVLSQPTGAQENRPAEASLSWTYSEGTPSVTAGTMLAVSGLPRGYQGNALAVGKDGDEYPLDVIFEKDALDEDGEPLEYWVMIPMPKGRPSVSDTYRITFDGLNEAAPLLVEVKGVRGVEGATTKLVRELTRSVYRDLVDRDIDPIELLSDAAANADAIPPELIPAVTILRIYRFAGDGDPSVSFLRDGSVPEWIIDSGANPRSARRAFDSYATALLQDRGILNAEDADPPGFQRINYGSVKHGGTVSEAVYRPAQSLFSGRATRVSSGLESYARKLTPTTPRIRSIGDIGPAIEAGRERERYLNVTVKAGKDTLKLAEWTIGFHPGVGAGIAIIDGFATMHQQHQKALLHRYPKKVAIIGSRKPGRSMLADDETATKVQAALMAYGEPYRVLLAQDGADAAIGGIGMAKAGFDILTKANKNAKFAQKALSFAEGRYIDLFKRSVEDQEKKADKKKQATVLKTIPGRKWGPFEITDSDIGPYFGLFYEGSWKAQPQSLTNNICWNGDRFAKAELFVRPSAFAGLKETKNFIWPVREPQLALSSAKNVIDFDESTRITSRFAGSEQNAVTFYPPNIGGLSGITDTEATYTAPAYQGKCVETAVVTASYPKDESRICAAAPRSNDVVVVARPDWQVKTPSVFACKPGKTITFTATHPDRPVQCKLTGPGQLTMSGNNGRYVCPTRFNRAAHIDCFTGEDETVCSPRIDINQRLAKFGAFLEIDGLRKDGVASNVDGLRLIGLNPDPDDADQIIARNEPLMAIALGGFFPGMDALNDDDDLPQSGGIVAGGGGGGPEVEDEDFHLAPRNGKYHRSLRLVPQSVVPDLWQDSISYSNTYVDESDDPRQRRKVSGALDLSLSSSEEGIFNYQGSGEFSLTVGEPSRLPEPNKYDLPIISRTMLVTKIKVTTDTKLSVRMQTQTSGYVGVQFAPVILMERTFPVTMVSGMHMMMPDLNEPHALFAPSLIEHEMMLPGPPEGYKTVEYALITTTAARPKLQKAGGNMLSGSFNWSGQLTLKTEPIRTASTKTPKLDIDYDDAIREAEKLEDYLNDNEWDPDKDYNIDGEDESVPDLDGLLQDAEALDRYLNRDDAVRGGN